MSKNMVDKKINFFEEILLGQVLYKPLYFESINFESIQEYNNSNEYVSYIKKPKFNLFDFSNENKEINSEEELKNNFIEWFKEPIDSTIDCYCITCGKEKTISSKLNIVYKSQQQ